YLDLGRRERAPAGGAPRPARTADAAPDAVGAKPAVGPADVPAGIHALVRADGLVQRGPGLFVLAALGQDNGQVLRRGRQFHGRAGRSVMRDGLLERGRIRSQEALTPQACRGRPAGWVSAAASAWQARAAVR